MVTGQRVCEVRGEYGYFHLWEQTPDGTYGLVEFFNGPIRRVIPTLIQFHDEQNEALKYMKEAKARHIAEALARHEQERNS